MSYEVLNIGIMTYPTKSCECSVCGKRIKAGESFYNERRRTATDCDKVYSIFYRQCGDCIEKEIEREAELASMYITTF